MIIECGHYWAFLDGQLVVVILDDTGKYYLCGGWECEIKHEDLLIIEPIEKPDMYKHKKLYCLT